MLYLDSVIFNYQIPEVPPNEKLRDAWEEETVAELWDQLQKQDPAAEKFVEPHNKRRIIRALEVMAATKRPFSELRRRREPKYDMEIVGLFPRQSGGQAGWDVLEKRIEQRVDEMLAAGLLDEIAGLQKKYGADLPLLKTLNYREAGDRAAMIRGNLAYAKKQMKWWAGREDINWQ